MIYWLFGTWLSHSNVILSAVVCGLLTLQLNIVYGVTCDTVSEHQYISHVYLNRILYMEWHVIQFQNISVSYIILKQNIAHGLMCVPVSEHQCISHVHWNRILYMETCDSVSGNQYTSHIYWNRILYMEWYVIEFQNISISHMYIESQYCTQSDMWYSFRTSLYLTCTLNHNIVHRVICDTVLEHHYISHVHWNTKLYVEWHIIVSEHQYLSHVHWNRILCMDWHIIISEHQCISHVHWKRILYMDRHIIV